MRRYETIFIADPDLQEDARKTLFDKYKNLLQQGGGILIDFDDWGNRKLAYPIKKKARGHYVCMTYGGVGELVTELERIIRLDDNMMKFMTVLLEKNVTASDLEAEIAAATQKEDIKEAASTAANEPVDEETEAAKADPPKQTETAEAAQEEK